LWRETTSAMASDVFQSQFYSDVKEPEDEILIVDFSYEATENIYNIKHDWGKDDLD